MDFLHDTPTSPLKKPQAISITRALGFNKARVNEFFQIYRSVLETAQYTPSRVWNMDERSPGKVVATNGARHVSKVTSGERGATVTVCAINAAGGGYLPPMFIFPRKRMVATLMNGAPPDYVGYCSPNGWIDADFFVKWLEHFDVSTNAYTENQQIMDGHHSHKTLAAITFARSKDIQLLVLPLHCTHRMQPLDTTFFKSLKTAYNNAVDSWMVTNPGRRMSFCHMAGVFNIAFNKSATLVKPVAGLRACGRWPYDSDVFTGDDFAAALLTGAHQATPGPSSVDVPTAGPLFDGSQTADPSCNRHPNAGPSSDEPPSAGPSSDDHATTDMPADETAASLSTVKKNRQFRFGRITELAKSG